MRGAIERWPFGFSKETYSLFPNDKFKAEAFAVRTLSLSRITT